MLIIFGILIVVTAVILGLIVLIQNPKGGGLSGTLGGFSNQLMGVKQTTDVMEKGTWIFAAIFAVLCLTSSAFIPKNGTASSKTDDIVNGLKAQPAAQQQQPAPQPAAQPVQATPVPAPATPAQKAP